MMGRVNSPGVFTAIPSAKVTIGPSGGRSPAYGAQARTCTPMIRIFGLMCFSASATPPVKPPPPSGTRTIARSAMSSASSRPSVACPATTIGSSYGWQKFIPVSSARERASATASFNVSPPSVSVAPYERTDSIFESDAPAGTKISQGTPKWRAANAMACAWLPALPATTPDCAASPSEVSLFIAPRILNEPVRCKFSAFKTTLPPKRSDKVSDSVMGVRFTTPAPASRAARMAAESIGGVVMQALP